MSSSTNSSPSRSLRSRMGGAMRRTSSILALARPTTPTTPIPAAAGSSSDDNGSGRRASVSQSVEGRKSTSSLAQSVSASQVAAPTPPPEPQPQLPAIAVDPKLEAAMPVDQTTTAPPPPPPAASADPTPDPAPVDPAPVAPAAEESAPPPSVADDPTPTPTPTPHTNGNASALPKAVKRLLPIAAQYQMYPSPIAESPAREAAASAEDLVAPPPVEEEAAAPTSTMPEPEVAPQQAAYVPPPLVLDSSNPGAFTDEPEEMSRRTSISVSAAQPEREPEVVQVVQVPVVQGVLDPAPEAEPVSMPMPMPEPEPETQPTLAPAPMTAEPMSMPDPVPMPVPETVLAPALDDPGYFDIAQPADLRPTTTVVLQAIAAGSPMSGSETVVGDAHDRDHDVHVSPYPYEVEPAPPVVAEVDVVGVQVIDPVSQPETNEIPEARTEEDDDALARAEMEARVWEEAHREGRGWVVHTDDEDPFADPAPPPAQTEGAQDSEGRRDAFFAIPAIAVDGEPERTRDVGGISSIHMPIPIPRSIHSRDEAQERFQFSFNDPVTDERRPLLSAEAPSYGPTNVGDPATGLTFRDLGWIEYVLPAGAATYYVHPTLRVTTDVDLRKGEALGRVGKALGYEGGGMDGASMALGRVRMEMWVRESAKGKAGAGKGKHTHTHRKGKGKGRWRGDLAELGLAKWWVDHVKREVSSGEDVVGLEDHMDMEYRYWAFMESHPAHAALPFDAKREAMDVLSWSWTDRLLAPQEQPLHPPFSQAECQELLGLLRSFGDLPQPDTGIQGIVVTRVVSRILLRVVQWRQHNFRSHKPLPLDVVGKRRSLGFFRATGQILVSIVLLGVPYLFNRPPHPRVDAEGGTSSSSAGAGRSVLPFLVVGACTCLLAAILLSASTTFLLLPELDGRARAIALGSAILAAGCMVSGLVALFKHKAEMAHAAAAPPVVTTHAVHHHYHYLNPTMGREGMMPLSTRSIVMSLPLVLLIYALLGFVAAVVVYSFTGGSQAGHGARFEDYTRWTALGVLGGVAGVLVTSVVFLR